MNDKNGGNDQQADVMKRMLLVAGFLLAITALIILITSKPASAATSNEDAMGEVWGNSFTAYAKWTYTSSDTIDIKLFHDGVEVARNEGNYGYSGSDYGYVSYDPIKTGTYKVQLWSSKDNKEVFSKDWVVPNLQINLAVSPTSGQIGTTFVATATFSTGTKSPDYYSFSGTLELGAGNSIFRQNVGGVLYSTHYYEYNKITDYTIKPVFTATGFTCPTKGEYMVSAQYSDTLTNISATSIKVSLTDQFEPLINQLKSDLNDTKSILDSTKAKLDKTTQELDNTKLNLNDSDKKLETVKNDSNTQIQNAKQFAYIGIIIGILGLLFGFVGIMMAKRRPASMNAPLQTTQYYPPQYQTPSQQYSAPPVPSVPPPQVAPSVPPPIPQVPSPPSQHVQSPFCGKCGKPLTHDNKFCPSCGAPK